MANPISIGIADEHKLFCDGLKNCIQQDARFKVKVEAYSGMELLEKMTRQRLDVVIAGMGLVDMHGIQIAKIINRDYKNVKVIGVSMTYDLEVVRQMVLAGAKGYLLKSDHPQEIRAAIHLVHAQKTYFSADISKNMMDLSGERERLDLKKELTPKEKMVVDLILTEQTDPEIASLLNLSPKSVWNYKKSAMDKLGVKTVIGLVKHMLNQRP